MQKTKNPSHLKDLVLLFSIPIGIALFAAAAIYVPRLLADPKYDFMYSLCTSYDCRNDYSVDSAGRVTKEVIDPSSPRYDNDISIIRYYDAANDSTRSLTFEEAQQYRLNTSSKSPDGFTLSKEERSSGFLFWSGGNEGWYLKDGAKKKKIELLNDGSYYSRDITFLGWIEK